MLNPYDLIDTNPQDDMSDASETRECHCVEGCSIRCEPCTDATIEAAALNAPAPCGPGLTEEERQLIQVKASNEAATAEAFRQCGSGHLSKPHDERFRILDNLLTRDAERADTVTLRREVVATFLSYCDDRRPFEKDDTRLCEAIAEAEAALAKGGEHGVG